MRDLAKTISFAKAVLSEVRTIRFILTRSGFGGQDTWGSGSGSDKWTKSRISSNEIGTPSIPGSVCWHSFPRPPLFWWCLLVQNGTVQSGDRALKSSFRWGAFRAPWHAVLRINVEQYGERKESPFRPCRFPLLHVLIICTPPCQGHKLPSNSSTWMTSFLCFQIRRHTRGQDSFVQSTLRAVPAKESCRFFQRVISGCVWPVCRGRWRASCGARLRRPSCCRRTLRGR